ncbi:hypothetical protein LTR17_026192 [Elasticomyces elasticus]|nr:hypothetical protein LTR17_026192 [Elasticomyces elasticus]
MPYYMSVPQEGMRWLVTDYITRACGRQKQLWSKAKPISQKKEMLKLLGSIRSKGRGSGTIEVARDTKYPSMVWQGDVEDDHIPVILDVIYSHEFDKEELAREAHACSNILNPDTLVRTVIIIEIPTKPSEMEGDDWNQTASINGWRFNSGTGAMDRWPEDGRFRKADGSAGPCQFELTVSDFLPNTESNEETDAMIIKFDMDEIREVLRQDEKMHDGQLRRLKNQNPSISDGPGSGEESKIEVLDSDESSDSEEEE